MTWRRTGLVALVSLAAGFGLSALVVPHRTKTTTVVSTPSSSDRRSAVRTETVLRTRTAIRRRVVTVTTTTTAPSARPAPPVTPSRGPAAPSLIPQPPTGPPTPRRRFAGTGPQNLGTLTFRRLGVLMWTTSGGRFSLSYERGGRTVHAIAATVRVGRVPVPPGTYRHVHVQSRGRWSVVIG